MTQNIPPGLLPDASNLSEYVPTAPVQSAQAEANALLAQGNPEAAASLVGLSADDMATIRAAARSPQDMANAVSGYVNLDANQKAAVSALASGNYQQALSKAILIGGQDLGMPPGLTSDLMSAGQSMLAGNLLAALGPLVAAGLAAGGVGAPVIACVGGCIALAEEGLQALGVIKTGPASCAWKIGNTCFNGDRPYGPEDPTWVPLSRYLMSGMAWPFEELDQYAATVYWEVYWLEKYLNAPTTVTGAVASAARKSTNLLGAISGVVATLASQVGASIGPQTKADWLKLQYQNSPAASNRALDGFRLAFGRAYLGNLEKGINGHPMTNPHQLLNQLAYAYNSEHGGASVTINGDMAPKTEPSIYFTVRPFGGGTAPSKAPPVNAGAYRETIIEKILRGDLDGNRDAPLTLYTGPFLNIAPAFHGGLNLRASSFAAPVKKSASVPAPLVSSAPKAAASSPWTPSLYAAGTAAVALGAVALWERFAKRR